MFGGFSRPAIDAVLTMWPSYAGSISAASSIIGVKTRMPCATPMTLTPRTHAQSAALFSQISPPAPTPALLKTKCGAATRQSFGAPHFVFNNAGVGAERLDLGRMGDV